MLPSRRDWRRLPVRAPSRNQPQVRLGTRERRPAARRIEVVAGVLDLERVTALADLIVGEQPVGAVDRPIAVDVEVVAHANGDALDVEGRHALVQAGRIGVVRHDVVGRDDAPFPLGAVTDVAEGEAMAELVGDEVEEIEDVELPGQRVDRTVDREADVAAGAAAVLDVGSCPLRW